MRYYNNISVATGKRTGIVGYDYDDYSIQVYFRDGSVYKYTSNSCGAQHLSNMKRLADGNSGLNTYLTKHKPQYESKMRF
jgi:hypothetical protein